MKNSKIRFTICVIDQSFFFINSDNLDYVISWMLYIFNLFFSNVNIVVIEHVILCGWKEMVMDEIYSFSFAGCYTDDSYIIYVMFTRRKEWYLYGTCGSITRLLMTSGDHLGAWLALGLAQLYRPERINISPHLCANHKHTAWAALYSCAKGSLGKIV